MAKSFKVKTKDNLGDRILRGIVRIFKRKPLIVNLNVEEPPKKCLLIGNHNGAGGPFSFRTFWRHRFMTWGAHPMCEGFKNRRRYLYHIFYRQKLGYGRIRAFLSSIGFGVISKLAYGFAGIIPIYYDNRLFLTYKYSFECLDKGVSVFIFPEDSTEGYKERIEKFMPGFLHLSRLYYKKYGVDLPIYTLYYNKKPKTIVIGKPMYYQELLKEHTDGEILKIYMDYMNSLREICYNKSAKEKTK